MLEIYTFTEKTSTYETRLNGWGFQIFIWTVLCEKYLKREFSLMNLTLLKEIWNLVDSPKLEMFEKEVLLSSLDKVMIKKENMTRLCSSYQIFEDKHGEGYNSSLPILMTWIKNNVNRPDFISMAYHGNSDSCHWWNDYNMTEKSIHGFLYEDGAIF